ncbi:MAG: TadE family protein [Cyanobacteria bacterium RYN_339]|nr:TadE family protein [Cyanobacteria bacterium RYN_339]
MRKGTALVEMALVTPILIGLLTGVTDLGYLYNHRLVLTNAAREGARVGALGRTDTQVRAAVLTYLQDSGYTPLPPGSDVGVSLAGDTAQVTVASTIPCLFASSGPAITMRAVAKMRRE